MHHLLVFAIFIYSKNDQEVLKITGPTLSGAGLTLKPYDVQPSIGK
jgi:hypothetical protein